jgi:hypothetical protein
MHIVFFCLLDNIQSDHRAYSFPTHIWTSPINVHKIFLSFEKQSNKSHYGMYLLSQIANL